MEKKLNNNIRNQINKIYYSDIVKKFEKFIKTKENINFLDEINRHNMETLIKKYNLQYLRKLGTSSRMRDIMRTSIIAITDYTGLSNINQNEQIYKKHPQPKVLKKGEIKKILKKSEFKPKGRAFLMYSYEEHKILKWERKNPAPTEKMLKEDLFPAMLKAAWNTQRHIALENIRDMLAKKYYGVEKENPYEYWKLYAMYKTDSNHVYETQPDPYIIGYPMAGITKDSPSELIIERLSKTYKKLYNSGGNSCIKVKLYNKFGNEIYSCAA